MQSYHGVNETKFTFQSLAQPWSNQRQARLFLDICQCYSRVLIKPPAVLQRHTEMENEELLVTKVSRELHWSDYVVFSLFLLISAAIGIYFSVAKGGQKNTKEFLTGSRSLSLIPVTISILVSFTSAILILGAPAELYLNGAMYLLYPFGKIVGVGFAAIIFVPLFYPLQLTSSFEVSSIRTWPGGGAVGFQETAIASRDSGREMPLQPFIENCMYFSNCMCVCQMEGLLAVKNATKCYYHSWCSQEFLRQIIQEFRYLFSSAKVEYNYKDPVELVRAKGSSLSQSEISKWCFEWCWEFWG